MELTVKQNNFIDEVNSMIIANGKKSLHFRMGINAMGGAHISMAVKDENGYFPAELIYLSLDNQFIIESAFQRVGKRINLKCKKNAVLVKCLIEQMMGFYI